MQSVPEDTTSSNYWTLFLQEVLGRSWHLADTIAAVCVTVILLVASWFEWEADMNNVGWQLVLFLFGAFVVVRMVMAPKWIREKESRAWNEKMKSLSSEVERLKEREMHLHVDCDWPHGGWSEWVRLIITSDAHHRTVHNVSASVVEYTTVPPVSHVGTMQPRSILLADNETYSIDLHSGNFLRVPFIQFSPNQTFRVVAQNLGFHLQHQEGFLTRITIIVTGQNAYPDWATFIVGFDKKGRQFFRRLKRVNRQVLGVANAVHPLASESD